MSGENQPEQRNHKNRVTVTIDEIAIFNEGGPYDGETHLCELSMLDVVIEQATNDHPEIYMSDHEAQQKEGYQPGLKYMKPNLAFLRSLSNLINDEQLLIDEATGDVRECRPSVANRIWRETLRIKKELKKNSG